jgi:hypothetical protein
MKKKERTENPSQADYAPKALLAIIAVVLGFIALDLLMAKFGINTDTWRQTFLFEAGVSFMVGIGSLSPVGKLRFLISNRARAWFLIIWMVIGAIFLFLSIHVT